MKSTIEIRGRDDYVMFQSITKLFIAIAVAYLVFKKKLSYSDLIVKFLPKYKHAGITILDILQHKSGLYYDWDNSNEYQTSLDHRRFALNLDQVAPVGEFHYNNYAYDILCEVVEKITGTRIDRFLGSIFFDRYGIKYFWYTKRKPFGGFGLAIPTKEIYKLPCLMNFLASIKYKHKLEHDLHGKYIGHSGSGGQFLYFTPDFEEFIFLANTGSEPFDNEFTWADLGL